MTKIKLLSNEALATIFGGAGAQVQGILQQTNRVQPLDFGPQISDGPRAMGPQMSGLPLGPGPEIFPSQGFGSANS